MDDLPPEVMPIDASDSLYSALGRFIVDFEQLVDALRGWTLMISSSHSPKSMDYTKALLAGTGAYEAWECFRSTLAVNRFHSLGREPAAAQGPGGSPRAEKNKPNNLALYSTEDQRVLRLLEERVKDLLEVRNTIAHASWHIASWDRDCIEARKQRKTKWGFEDSNFYYRVEDFGAHSHEARILHAVVTTLGQASAHESKAPSEVLKVEKKKFLRADDDTDIVPLPRLGYRP